MHVSALNFGKLFFETYCAGLEGAVVYDVGAQNVNGSLKDVLPAHLGYVGVDFVAGNGVDIVLEDPYRLPFADGSLDVLVCSSCFEHSQFFWLVFLEMLRVLKPQGLLYLNMPSNGSFHRYPVDCWRFYPDSGRALEAWGARNGCPVRLLESFVGERSTESYESGGAWHDFVAVFVKDGAHAAAYPARILDALASHWNGYDSRTGAETRPEFLSPDHAQMVARERTIDALGEQLAEADQERVGLEAQFGEQLAARDAQLRAAQVRLEDILQSRSLTITARERTIDALREQLAQADQERVALAAQLAQVDQERVALGARLEHQLAAVTRELAARDAQLRVAHARVEEILHSRSWRITAPVRKMMGAARTVRALVARRAAADAALIRASGQFDEGFYRASNPELPAGIDLVAHYCTRGWREGRDPSSRFSTRYYLDTNPDIRAGGINPFAHYLRAGAAEQRKPHPDAAASTAAPAASALPPSPAPAAPAARTGGLRRVPRGLRVLRRDATLAAEVQTIRDSGCFDEAFYRETNRDLQPPPEDAIRHYCESGWREGRDPSREFSTRYYLAANADIRDARINPFWHYVTAGRKEQRQARPDWAHVSGELPFDPARATVLVVSHEASLTGAPVLSLNIVRGLRQKYNVVSLLLGEGPLQASFREESVAVAGPVKQRYSPEVVDSVVNEMAGRYEFAFAVVNSIESSMVLEPLARRSVPTVALIHEFASYVRPRSAFRNTFFWADEIVFSTRLTYSDALSAYPELAAKHCHIVAQGRCLVPTLDSADAAEREKELARVRSILRPAAAPANSLLVVGIGFVQIRKGVEYFIDCAARVLQGNPGRPCRFVWVGKGYDPERDMAYSVYLADQIQRSGLAGRIEFMGDTHEIGEVYSAADVLLVTSRLDPLPNVAIDAMANGRPVFCFDRTTGIAEILADHGLREQCVAGYLDSADLAAKVIAVANSEELARQIGARLQQVAAEVFDMQAYLRTLDSIAESARARVAQERSCADVIVRSVQLNEDYVQGGRAGDTQLDAVRWNYVRPWSSGILPRKPFPGFHPGVFGEQAVQTAQGDLLAHYIRAGKPDGPWNFEVISASEPARGVTEALRVALHLHVYYPEMLEEMLGRLGRNRTVPTLLVSVRDEAARQRVILALARYQGESVVEVVPNRGRDIGPFLTAFGPRIARDFDIVGHVHTKKTADVADAAMAERWREFLLENLLGGKAPMADIILGRMAADPSIGMVFPDDPHAVGWGGNLDHARPLAVRLGLDGEFPRHFVFPIGTMFWARVDAIRPLLALGLDWPDYPAEPLPYDGSMLHALERILPFVVGKQGQRVVLTNVPGVTR